MNRHRRDGKHIHKCTNPSCLAVWEHGNDCSRMYGGTQTEAGKKFFYDAHTCPLCGYCEFNPKGEHGTDAMGTVTVNHPVQCPISGPHPAAEVEDFLEMLLAAMTARARKVGVDISPEVWNTSTDATR